MTKTAKLQQAGRQAKDERLQLRIDAATKAEIIQTARQEDRTVALQTLYLIKLGLKELRNRDSIQALETREGLRKLAEREGSQA